MVIQPHRGHFGGRSRPITAPDGASGGVLRLELSDPAAAWPLSSPKVPESPPVLTRSGPAATVCRRRPTPCLPGSSEGSNRWRSGLRTAELQAS
jgi:hypothetical protein